MCNSRSKNTVFNGLSWLAACMVLMGAAGSVLAEPRAFEIVAGDAVDTLKEFARQADLQTLFDYRLVHNLHTQEVRGDLEAEEALRRMLAGTGLEFDRVNERTVAIRMQKVGALVGGESQEVQLAQAGGEQVSAAAAEEKAGEPKLEEVVVTAQKRKELLKDVPISITVLRGGDLDSSSDRGIADALNRIPGVINSVNSTTARNGSNAGTIVVRGVSPDSGAANTTAYYLDSIPFGFVRKQYQPDATAFDLERVEVLRGPQGTLYGLSSLNGVVRVLTKDADLDKFEFKGRASAFSTQDGSESYRGDMALNVPVVTGKLGIRAVAGYQDIGGWIDKPIRKDANDAQIGNYRLKINAQPTEQLSVGLLGWFYRSDIGAPSNTADGLSSQSVVEEPSSTDYDAYGMKVGYDFSRVSLTSMTSYIDFKNPATVDYSPFVTNNYLNLGFFSKVFSQEMVLNSEGKGPWRWSAGGIFRDAKDRLFTTRTIPATGVLAPGYIAPTIQDSESDSYAVFGELTRSFFDGRWELTGGLRYFEDTVKEHEISRRDFIGGTVAPPPSSQALINTKNDFNHTAPRLVLTWHPVSQSTLYASYGEGFRSGINQLPSVRVAAPQFAPAKPDSLRNYEIGAKGSLWGGALSYDAAVFYMDWRDVQQSLTVVVIPPPVNLLQAAFINVGSASGMGYEFAVTAVPVRRLTLGASFSWNDLKVDRDVMSFTSTGVPFVLYPKGGRLGFSPQYTAGASADYAFPLGGGGYQGHASASISRIAKQISGRFSSTSLYFADAMSQVRASVGIQSPSGWAASLFGENLTNEKGITQDQFSPRWNTYLRPRMAGLQFEFRY